MHCVQMYASLGSRMYTVCVRMPAVDASIQLPVYADLAEDVLQPVDSWYQRLSQAFQMPRCSCHLDGMLKSAATDRRWATRKSVRLGTAKDGCSPRAD